MLLGRRKKDPVLDFIQQELKIQNKAGQLVPLVLNPLQLRLYQEIQRQREAGKPVRIIILKARQIGFSTATAALFYQRASTITHRSEESVVILNFFFLFRLFGKETIRQL